MFFNIGLATGMLLVVLICSYQAVMLRAERKIYQEAISEYQDTMVRIRDMHSRGEVLLTDIKAMHISEGERLAGRECVEAYDKYAKEVLNGTGKE